MGAIPTLHDVLLDARQSGLYLKIELKGPNTVEPTLQLVEHHNLVHQCSFSSFDAGRLRLLRKLRSEKDSRSGRHIYRVGILFNDLPVDFLQQARDVGADEIHLRYDTCERSIIARIHKEGFESMAWFRGPIGMALDTATKYWDVGNEDSSMYQTVLKTGVQQLCLNKPDVMIAMLRDENIES